MAQPNAKTPITLVAQIEIDALSYGPYGIGRVDGKAVMIPNTAPGDTVLARISESKERYAIGAIERLIHSSTVRQTPSCPYVGRCGGCSWQHIQYDAQLKAKEQSVADALRRIGKLDDFALKPIIASSATSHYRRRIRLQTGRTKRLGFYGPASHDLVEIDSCLIAAESLNSLIEPVRRWLRNLATTIEHIELASGDKPDETVIVAQAAEPFIPRDQSVCELLLDSAKSIQGLILLGLDWRKSWGQTSITLRLRDDLTLTLDADVFTQVNSDGNRRMLAELLTAADFKPDEEILELYCGAGNFTLPIASQVRKIVAVEGYRAAIANGKLNAQKNSLENIRWLCSPVPRAVAQLQRQKRSFNKIVLDPPRIGAKGIEADLTALGAAMICYVSCNPTTLARDLAALTQHGYKLQSVQPFDFFPHTFHVESLSIMTR